MSTSGALLVVCCTETTPSSVIDPARYMNTTDPRTTILKTDGARVTDHTVASIYNSDQRAPQGMIVVMGHAGCTLASGDVQGTLRTSVRALQHSPYIRKGIPIIGYVLDFYTPTPGTAATEGRLREVSYPSASASSASNSGQQQTSNQQQDLGPFWS